MESTGVYWIPIFELLDERGVEVFLVNARDAKHVPGRKTDVSDAQWLSATSLLWPAACQLSTEG
jgi:transposase